MVKQKADQECNTVAGTLAVDYHILPAQSYRVGPPPPQPPKHTQFFVSKLISHLRVIVRLHLLKAGSTPMADLL